MRNHLVAGLLALVSVASCWRGLACAETREYLYLETPAGALATYEIKRDGSLILIATFEEARRPNQSFVQPATASLAIEPGGRFAYSTGAFARGTDFSINCFTVDPTDGRLVQHPAACAPPISVQGGLSISPDGRALFAYQAGQGIEAYSIDQSTGKLTNAVSPGCPSPCWRSLINTGWATAPVIDPSGRYAYVIRWQANNVATYRIGSDGALRFVGSVSTGAHPIAMAVDPGGYFAYVANVGDNTISEYFIDPLTGSLRANPDSMSIATGAPPSSVVIDASGNFLYCARQSAPIAEYRIQPDGTLQSLREAPAGGTGGGPMVTDPSGKFLWMESGAGGMKAVLKGFRIESDGHLAPLNSEAIPMVAGPPGFTPVTSWTGPPPPVHVARRDLGPLLKIKPAVAGTFTQVPGRMSPPRGGMGRLQTGTLLPDGRAFIAESGFARSGEPEVTGEIYDPETATFTSAGVTIESAYLFARLPDGRFLINRVSPGPKTWTLAILDPVTAQVTSTGSLRAKCIHPTFWLLKDGRIFFPDFAGGGLSDHRLPACEGEIFDSSSGKSIPTPAVLSKFRIIAVLPDGRLLLLSAMKLKPDGSPEQPTPAYVYDLSTRELVRVADFSGGRQISAPVALNDGSIFFLSAKGYSWPSTAYLFDPASAKFVELGQPHGDGMLTRLLDGRVLITQSGQRSDAEFFDPHTRKFTTTGSMTTVRLNPTVVVLKDGNVLFAGGDIDAYYSWQGLSPYDTAEIYHPSEVQNSNTSSRRIRSASLTLVGAGIEAG